MTHDIPQTQTNDEFKLSSNIVSLAWLVDNLDHDNLVILDATMKKMPNGEPIETPSSYIAGAFEFNFDTEICDKNSALPHMLPSEEIFEKAAQARGINADTLVVVYDAMGVFSSPRVWWMFKVMGHENVVVLNGGLPAWLTNNLPTHPSFQQADKQGHFVARYNSKWVYCAEQIFQWLELHEEKAQVIDARSLARFCGDEEEPRAGLAKGHIPESQCLPFTSLLEDGFYKPTEVLSELLHEMIEDSTEHVIFSCGSGVTACILALAADESGIEYVSVYDGSWAEWGNRDDLPVEV